MSDLVAAASGFLVAFVVQEIVRPVPRDIMLEHALLALATLPAFAIGGEFNRLYRSRANERRREELRNILRTVVVGFAFLLALSFALQFGALSRLWVLAASIAVTAALVAEREVVRRIFRRMRLRGDLLRRIVIVGTDAHAFALMHAYDRSPQLGYQVLGFVGDDRLADRGQLKVLGGLDQVLDVVEQHEAVGVVLSLPSVPTERVNELTRKLTDARYHVTLSSGLHDIDMSRLRPQQVDGHTVLYVEPIVRTGWRARAKRVFDVVMASAILIVSLPIAALAALAVKIDSRGPVIFRQVRVGKDGRLFELYKFRTMVIDAEARRDELQAQNEADGPLFKIERDPRITRVGRILRKLSIDELPQLLCVLQGEMSMVGPRPALPDEVAGWTDDVHERLRVMPGITGMWQVSGRSDSTFEHYKRMDMYYVDNWSLRHDLLICGKTVGVVLTGRGAS